MPPRRLRDYKTAEGDEHAGLCVAAVCRCRVWWTYDPNPQTAGQFTGRGTETKSWFLRFPYEERAAYVEEQTGADPVEMDNLIPRAAGARSSLTGPRVATAAQRFPRICSMNYFYRRQGRTEAREKCGGDGARLFPAPMTSPSGARLCWRCASFDAVHAPVGTHHAGHSQERSSLAQVRWRVWCRRDWTSWRRHTSPSARVEWCALGQPSCGYRAVTGAARPALI